MNQSKQKPQNVPRPDKMAEKLEKIEQTTHKKFHSSPSVKRKKQKATDRPTSSGDFEESQLRPPEESTTRKKKKAVVVIGCLTGNFIADRAFRNTAKEAVSDLTDRGYKTTLLDQPTSKQLQSFIADPCVKAFVYVGHGSDEDSGNPKVGGKDGGDFLWPNCDEVITSSDIKRWMNKGTMEVVILHACYQGAPNTARRWRAAFGVSAAGFDSWSGLCRYFTAYWWQLFWS